MEGLDEELCCMKCVDPFAAVNPLGNKGAAMRLVSQCCYKLELSCAIICSDQISTPHGDMTHENLPHPLFKVSQETDVRKSKPNPNPNKSLFLLLRIQSRQISASFLMKLLIMMLKVDYRGKKQ